MEAAVTDAESISGKAAGIHSVQRGSWAVLQGIAGGVIIALLNASTGILTARVLMPSGRGELAAMTIWPLLLAYLSSLGMPSAIIYSLRLYKQDSARLIPTAILSSFALGSLAALAGIGSLPFWLRHYPYPVVRASQWFLLAVPACAVIQTGRAVLEVSGLNILSNTVQVSQPAATLVMLICFMAAHHLTPVLGGLAYTLATVPTLLIVLSQLRRLLAANWRMHWRSARMLAGYGVRSFGIDILGALAFQVDQVLVINLLTPAAMGTYGVALSLSRMLNLFQGSVITVLFPRAAGRSPADILALTEFSARVSTLLTVGCAASAALVGPFLLRSLYGAAYASAKVPFEVMLAEVSLNGAAFILAQAYMALGRPGLVTVIQSVGLGLSVPLLLLLIPRWGILGAATALLLSTLARFIFVFAGFRLILGLRLPDLLPRFSDIETVLRRFRRLPSEEKAAACIP